jgi:hypothetical protein
MATLASVVPAAANAQQAPVADIVEATVMDMVVV